MQECDCQTWECKEWERKKNDAKLKWKNDNEGMQEWEHATHTHHRSPCTNWWLLSKAWEHAAHKPKRLQNRIKPNQLLYSGTCLKLRVTQGNQNAKTSPWVAVVLSWVGGWFFLQHKNQLITRIYYLWVIKTKRAPFCPALTWMLAGPHGMKLTNLRSRILCSALCTCLGGKSWASVGVSKCPPMQDIRKIPIKRGVGISGSMLPV